MDSELFRLATEEELEENNSRKKENDILGRSEEP